MPPRHGKSEFISRFLPAWYLGHWPDRNVIVTSYESAQAEQWSRKVRDIIQEKGPVYFNIQVKKDVAAASWWEIEGFDGGMRAAGVGGAITGKGADLLIIDDPTKNSEEAGSENFRKKLKEWFFSTAFTRLTPNGKMLMVFTRWTYDDLLTLVQENYDPASIIWINFPAIAEAPSPQELDKLGIIFEDWTDEIGRHDGDALWPERFPISRLNEIRRAPDGEKTWSALYQQRPSDREGAVFEESKWQFYLSLPKFSEICQFVDTAFKTGVTNDFSVSAAWGVTHSHDSSYLLSLVRNKLEFTELIEMLYDHNQRLQREFRMRVKLVIEDKASGQSAIQVLRKQKHLTVVPFDPKSVSKIARAEAASEYQPQMWIPKYADYTRGFIAEHTLFPFGQKDDQVDTTAMMAHRYFINRQRFLKAFD